MKTVLLVKDDLAGLIALALILRSEGYVVLESSDGDEAIQVCLEHQGPIHLLLMDFELGGSDAGPRLAERLLELSPEMQVLFMFSSPPIRLLEAGTLPWGCTLLRKPFGPETLLRAAGESLIESDRPAHRLAGGAAITLDDALRVVNAPRKEARRLRRVAGRRKPPAVVNRSQCEIEGGRILGERQGHERAHRRALKGRSSHA